MTHDVIRKSTDNTTQLVFNYDVEGYEVIGLTKENDYEVIEQFDRRADALKFYNEVTGE